MSKSPQEWLKQADYDINTAEIMFDNKRYFYAVFMCHLSVEKALKGPLSGTIERNPLILKGFKIDCFAYARNDS